jgi:hypothetical protein
MKIFIGFLIAAVGFFVLVFYRTYEMQLLRSEKEPELRHIAIKSAKFAGTIIFFVALFVISLILCDRYQISFWISFLISVFIAVGLWGFCKLFNIKNPIFSAVAKMRAKKSKEIS